MSQDTLWQTTLKPVCQLKEKSPTRRKLHAELGVKDRRIIFLISQLDNSLEEV